MSKKLENIVKFEIVAKNVKTHLYIICDLKNTVKENADYNKEILGDKLLKFLKEKTDNFWIFYKNTRYPKEAIKNFIKTNINYLVKSITKPIVHSEGLAIKEQNVESEYFISDCERQVKKYIKEKVERKYVRTNSNFCSVLANSRSLTNVFIVDNLAIEASMNHYFRLLVYNKNYVVINPKLPKILEDSTKYITRYTAVTEITPIDLIAALNLIGITEKNVIKTFEKYQKRFKNKQKPNLVLLGLGGVGNSFIYWLDKLVEHFQVEPLFNTLALVDGDNIEYHNLYRLPLWDENLKLNPNQTLSKVDMIIQSYTDNKISNEIISFNKFINSKADLEEILQKCPNPIIYGGPTIQTRQLLYHIQTEKLLNFDIVYCLNQNNVATLEYNPDYSENMELASETYGTLNVSIFLLNQLMAAYKFILNLANDKQENEQIAPIPYYIDYHFKKQIKGLKYFI